MGGEKIKEKRPKREGAWSGSLAAKSLDKGAGALRAVPVSPRASRSPKGRHKADHGVDGRLAAIELCLASAEARFAGADKLAE